MAVNIFTGANNSKSSKTNAASASTRAQAARQALAQPAEVSNSGTTAVGTKGTLSKVANTVGKIAGVVGKFLPGIGGTIAKGIEGVFNDPEWWQHVNGEAITLNEPLRLTYERQSRNLPVVGQINCYNNRATFLEFVTVGANYVDDGDKTHFPLAGNKTSPGTATFEDATAKLSVIVPTEQMITQYLLPEIRKVVNAIPLQDAEYYKTALSSAATIYALWRNLKKYDYMLKHGQTFVANMNDPAFPLFQTENAAWLQATINRLEEYLRANIRIPHTMCEYLAWRFGRVYRSNSSAKAAMVLYNVLPMHSTTGAYDALIDYLMNQITNTPEVQKANTDLYNAYYDHDLLVEVRDETQCRYDLKEFMLRANLQKWAPGIGVDMAPIVIIDSELDNPTTFMASTISSQGQGQSGEYEALFRVHHQAYVYIPQTTPGKASNIILYPQTGSAVTKKIYTPVSQVSLEYVAGSADINLSFKMQVPKPSDNSVLKQSTLWAIGMVEMDQSWSTPTALTTEDEKLSWYQQCMFTAAILAKPVDLYYTGAFAICQSAQDAAFDAFAIDVTSLSIDAGKPTARTLNTEHIYAFANLVSIEAKHSMSYKQAEKLVAKDTANLVETLDVAAPAAPPVTTGKA